MKVTLIHNPDAGSTDESCTDQIANSIRAAGHSVFCQSCRSAGWENALVEPADLIAVAGGDGIVGTVAKRMIGKSVPITVLPMGTANNIASTLGLTGISYDDLIKAWASARRIQLDVGTASGPWGQRYFIEGLGCGLFTDVMSKLDARQNIDLAHLNAPKEKLDSVVQIMKYRLDTHPAYRLILNVDGRDLSGEYILLEAMNVRCIGPNLCIVQAGPPGDGLLDLVLAAANERDQIMQFLSDRLEGAAGFPGLTVQQARQVHIECAGTRFHIDDDLWPKNGFSSGKPEVAVDITVESKCLEMLLPA
ncbi:MAG TPA: diacylglycerol kinase family protein [Candidatus Binatia bacterium]